MSYLVNIYLDAEQVVDMGQLWMDVIRFSKCGCLPCIKSTLCMGTYQKSIIRHTKDGTCKFRLGPADDLTTDTR